MKEKTVLSMFKTKSNSLFRTLPESVKAHSRRVQYYSEIIYDKFVENGSYASDELIFEKKKNELSFGAKLHDIGKVNFDDPEISFNENMQGDVLKKYQNHTLDPYDIFKQFSDFEKVDDEKEKSFFKTVFDCINQHHENFDGSGYPNENCASQIPLCARIVSVADAFDNLATGNDNRDALPFDECVEIIKSSSCELFDPVVVTTLEECLPKIVEDDHNGKLEKVSGGRKSLRGIELLYRPVYDYNNRSTYGYQTLLRLNDKKCGQLNYDFILKAAEHSGKICDLTKWAVQEACEALIRLDKRNRYVGILFIDFSAKCFEKKFFVENIVKIISSFNLEPGNFCLVLPESSISYDSKLTADGIKLLREKGFKVAIGGFGSEYANIAALNDFDVDYVMLNNVFVKNVLTSNRAKKICDSVIDMANKIDILTIADGIDSKELAVALFSSNCALMRGTRFGKYTSEAFI